MRDSSRGRCLSPSPHERQHTHTQATPHVRNGYFRQAAAAQLDTIRTQHGLENAQASYEAAAAARAEAEASMTAHVAGGVEQQRRADERTRVAQRRLETVQARCAAVEAALTAAIAREVSVGLSKHSSSRTRRQPLALMSGALPSP